MFFETIDEARRIATGVSGGIFVMPVDMDFSFKNMMILEPEEKTTITIEQVHKMLDTLQTKQNMDRFIIIRSAEKMTTEAANAILKNLEEPQERAHFLLITESPMSLLPTIRSRCETYVWKGGVTKISEIKADEKIKILSKKLLAAKPADLVNLAEEICKKKDGVRAHALSVLSVAIEMAYKSYFVTGNKAFLSKIPKFIEAYDNISMNGHVKLHLVADLV